MLLGNNLWSLKAANMADLALLVFHFGECSYTSQPVHPSSTFLNLHFSLPPTFLLTLLPFPPLSSSCLSHHRILLLLVASMLLNFPFPPPLLPSLPAHFSSLDLFQCLLISSAHFCFIRQRAAEGDRRRMTRKVAVWIWTCKRSGAPDLQPSPSKPPTRACTAPHKHSAAYLASWHHYMLNTLHGIPFCSPSFLDLVLFGCAGHNCTELSCAGTCLPSSL